MKLIGPSQPLRVVSKLLHKNCNIGTEGTLDVYLCDTAEGISKRKVAHPAPTYTSEDQVILSVFIALHEEFSVKAISAVPADDIEATADFNELMTMLQNAYMEHSIMERNKCAQPQLH